MKINYLALHRPNYLFLWALPALILPLVSCLGKLGKPQSVKFQQYYVQGEQLYVKNCSNCHQKSGEGLGLLYPPLNKSDFMEKNPEKVFCLMKYGISGPMVVNGQDYNKKMPGVPSLTELEIAEIATYVYNSWSHEMGIVETEQVTKVIEACRQ
jgi:cytochrome c551